MPDNFFAVLNDGAIRRISLVQKIENSIRSVFVANGQGMLDNREEVEFDGNYKIEDDEVLYVSMGLPDNFSEVVNNSIGIPVLDLKSESIKSLFWYENHVYYFQNFDSRKLLQNKNVIFYNNQTYDRLSDDAFVVDNIVNAVYKDKKFFFLSYSNANKIFSLAEYYQEATNEEVAAFGKHRNILISDSKWFMENSNTIIRKQITLIQKSKILDGANTGKIKSKAKKFKLNIELDKKGKIVFPSDKKVCREILLFLNEQYYIGLITGNHYKTSSKKTA